MKLQSLMMAAAMAAATAFGAAAHAATYNFGTIGSTGVQTHTSDTINHTSGSFVDTFDFTVVNPLTEFSTGAFTELGPFSITSADFTLYNSADKQLATSGMFNPTTQVTPTISADLTAGSYYLLSNVTIPTGKFGSYTLTATTLVSPTPEPASWVLMIAGVGLAGATLRRSRRLETPAFA